MKRASVAIITLIVLLALLVTACGGGEPAVSETTPPATTPTEQAASEQPTPTQQSLEDLVSGLEEDSRNIATDDNVFATGFVEATQDADLVFQVNGQVGEVLVEEGERVKEGQILAVLDTRPFDQDVRNAEAALIAARADELALVEDPVPEQVQAAQANVAQAAGNLEQVQGSVTQADIAAAQASVDEARARLADLEDGTDALDIAAQQANYDAALAGLQRTRDQLSYNKTQAEIGVDQAAENLRVAQVNYSDAYWDWRYVRDHGKAPPQTDGPNMNPPLSSQSEQDYRDRLNQAEANLRSAEEGVTSAQQSLEEARQAEITGIQQAEAQVRNAEIALEQVQEPPDEDVLAQARAQIANAEANLARLQGQQRSGQLSAAQAGLAAAQANLDLLFSEPTESQMIRAESSISRAEANLEQARLNREYAEIRAPFGGDVAVVNIDPGDPGTTAGAGGQAAIRLVDMSELRVEVDVTDADIAHIEAGQRAVVVADALPDQEFIGRVDFISPTADTNPQGVTTYRVRVVMDEQDLPLRVGMSVSVTINASSGNAE